MSPRRWFRFRLRTLLVFIAVVAAPLAWVAKERRQSAYEQQLAEELLEQDALINGGVFAFGGTLNGLRFKFGGPFDSWKLDSLGQPQESWSRLARFVLGTRIVGFEVWGRDISELRPLSALNCLESISISPTSARDLHALAEFKKLRRLVVRDEKLQDLKPLIGLTELRVLVIDWSEVVDLKPLTALSKLERVSVMSTLVTKWDVEELQQVLPRCKIEHDPFP